MDPQTSKKYQRVIALMNQKGGVGKTTTTANLGAALAEWDADVLLVDIDPQANLTIHVGLDPDELEITNYDLLNDEEVTAAELVHEIDEHLFVLPAEVNLAGLEAELVNRPNKQTILKEKLAPIVPHFDYVLIDCPPSLGLLTVNALTFVQEVVVPMQAHFLPLQGLSKLLETIQIVRDNFNEALRLAGVVLCMYDAQTRLANEVVNDLEQFFAASHDYRVPWAGAKIFDPPIRRNVKLAECPSFGETIFQYSPWCPGAMDYRRLAEQFIDEAALDVGSDAPGPEAFMPKTPVPNPSETVVSPSPQQSNSQPSTQPPYQSTPTADTPASLQSQPAGQTVGSTTVHTAGAAG